MARAAPEVIGSSHDDGGTARLDTCGENSHDSQARVRNISGWTHRFGANGMTPRKAVSCLLLIAFTALRITVNVAMVLSPDSMGRTFFYGDHWPIPVQVVDGVFRPLLGALSLVPFFFRRYRGKPLYEASHLGCFVSAFASLVLELHVIMATSEEDGQWYFGFDGGLLMSCCWASRFGLAMVTAFKFYALGWGLRASVGFWAWIWWLVAYGIVAAVGAGNRSAAALVLLYTSQGVIAAMNGSVLFYEAHLKQSLVKKKTNKGVVKTAARVVWFLRLGAFLTLFDSLYLPFVETFGNEIGLIPAFFLTFDNCVVLATVLILAGLIGPRDALDQGEVLAELEHMGRTQGKRIAFPGKVNQDSQHCIVSFPGKYSEEWDAAVRMVEVRSGACSLACVFLTDHDSGLGVHEANPEEPGNCWCKALYGQVPAVTYISVVEDPTALSAEDLRFRESDARAMGQIFLKRESQNDEKWNEDKEAAQMSAKTRCEENRGRAPWGCRWFHDWKRNVDRAAALGQTLHVFYFQGRVGCGKLPWQELSNETSVKKARENGGLGASQTAEVAYLERSGYKFQEHDVTEFYGFMESH